jgi:hypothetical protein
MRHRRIAWGSRWIWLVAAAMMAGVVLLGSHSYGYVRVASSFAFSGWNRGAELQCRDDRPNRQLYLLMPINKAGAGPNLCKAILSTIVQGYKPIIINWESTSRNVAKLQIEKVTGE